MERWIWLCVRGREENVGCRSSLSFGTEVRAHVSVCVCVFPS